MDWFLKRWKGLKKCQNELKKRWNGFKKIWNEFKNRWTGFLKQMDWVLKRV